jgi:hypothetical protein
MQASRQKSDRQQGSDRTGGKGRHNTDRPCRHQDKKVTGSMGQTGQADKAGTIVKGHAGIKTKVTGSMDRKVDGTIR